VGFYPPQSLLSRFTRRWFFFSPLHRTFRLTYFPILVFPHQRPPQTVCLNPWDVKSKGGYSRQKVLPTPRKVQFSSLQHALPRVFFHVSTLIHRTSCFYLLKNQPHTPWIVPPRTLGGTVFLFPPLVGGLPQPREILFLFLLRGFSFSVPTFFPRASSFPHASESPPLSPRFPSF